MKRRDFLAGATALSLLPRRVAAEDGPVNVCVVTADDMAIRMFLAAMLPQTSAIAAEGTVFNRSYVATPFCAPNRASFLTGLYPAKHKITGDTGAAVKFAPWEPYTIAVQMAGAGKATAMVGKYLNDAGGLLGDVPVGWNHWKVFDSPGYKPFKLWSYDGPASGGTATLSGSLNTYSTTTLAADAVAWLNALPAEDEFFLWFCPHAPHMPATAEFPADLAAFAAPPFSWAPSFNEMDVSDKPPSVQALNSGQPLNTADITILAGKAQHAAAALLSLDRAVASIRDALIALGRWDDTVFVFVSDNGLAYGEHRINADKLFPYEPCIRMPLVMRGPGILAQSTDALASMVDLPVTLLEMVGAAALTTPAAVSLVPVLTLGMPVRYTAYFEQSKFTGTMRADGIKYVRWKNPTPNPKELYDLDGVLGAADPDELASVHADPAYAAMLSAMETERAALAVLAAP